MKKLVYIIFAVCLLAGVTFGAETNFTNGAGGNLWKTAGNWSTGSVPGNDYAIIAKPGVDCIIDSSTAAVAENVWIGYSLYGGNGQLAMTGGTLNMNLIHVGIDSVGTFTLSGGDVTCTDTFNVGSYDYVNSGNGTLEMTGGTITTLAMAIPNIASPATGVVKLYGGTITITGTSGLSFMMQYNSSSTGSLDIRGTGVFKWAGDHVTELNWYKGLGYIYSSAPLNYGPVITFDGTHTIITSAPRSHEGELSWTNAASDGRWNTPGNWNVLAAVPFADETAVIAKPTSNCIIDSSTAAVADKVWIGYSLFGGNGQLAMTGGTLNTNLIHLGIDSVGTFTLSGGDVTCTDTFNVGSYDYVNSGNGTLEMTGGTITTLAMAIPNIGSPATGAVKLYGGTITITGTSGLSFMMQYNSSSTGSLDIKGTGVFKWAGDHIAELNWYKGLGNIYTSEAGKALTIEYVEGVTLAYIKENFVSSFADLDKSGVVDVDDLGLMAENWLQWEASSLTNPNPVIFAPHISKITVDGDLSDWTGGSDWATFGEWYEYGLNSMTQAKYAWNATDKRLYIGIETTEPDDITIEIAGLMGDPNTDPNATVASSGKTAFYELKVSGSSVTVNGSVLGRSITGVEAKMYVVNGTTRTFEVSTPIYTDWAAGTGEHTLEANTNIYNYVNLFADTWSDIYAADSQVWDGPHISLAAAPLMQVGSAIRLLSALPADDCSDMPAGRGNLANIAGGDCIVNFSDFAALAQEWLSCTLAGGCQ